MFEKILSVAESKRAQEWCRQFFYITLIVVLVKRVIYSSLIGGLLPEWTEIVLDLLCYGLPLVLSCIKVIIRKHSVPVFFCLLSATVIIYLNSSNATMLGLLVLIYSASGEDFDTICKVSLVALGASLASVVFFSQFGLIENHVWMTERGPRYGFGFLYTSYLSLYIFNFSALTAYHYRKKATKIKAIVGVILLILNYFVYLGTQTRANFFLTVAVIILVNIAEIIPRGKVNPLFEKIVGYIHFPLAVLSAFISASYDSSVAWMKTLNTALSNRLAYIHSSLMDYGVLPFGRHVEMAVLRLNLDGTSAVTQGVDNRAIDNAYMSVLILQGVLGFSLLLLLLTKIALKLIREQNLPLLCILSLFSVYALVNPQLLQIQYNTFVLLPFAIL